MDGGESETTSKDHELTLAPRKILDLIDFGLNEEIIFCVHGNHYDIARSHIWIDKSGLELFGRMWRYLDYLQMLKECVTPGILLATDSRLIFFPRKKTRDLIWSDYEFEKPSIIHYHQHLIDCREFDGLLQLIWFNGKEARIHCFLSFRILDLEHPGKEQMLIKKVEAITLALALKKISEKS